MNAFAHGDVAASIAREADRLALRLRCAAGAPERRRGPRARRLCKGIGQGLTRRAGEEEHRQVGAKRDHVTRRRIGVEAMDFQAACRTYNILMAEGRKAVLALLIETAARQPHTSL